MIYKPNKHLKIFKNIKVVDKIMHIKRIFTLAVILVLLIFIMGCSSQDQQNNNQTEEQKSKEGEKTSPNTTTEIIKGSDTKPGEEVVKEQVKAIADGVYNGEVTYAYPAGEEKKGTNTIGIMIEVQDEVITKAGIAAIKEPDPVSKNFITAINNALPELVVGKKITELNLPNQISGSSLTAGALKDYLNGLVETEKSKNA